MGWVVSCRTRAWTSSARGPASAARAASSTWSTLDMPTRAEAMPGLRSAERRECRPADPPLALQGLESLGQRSGGLVHGEPTTGIGAGHADAPVVVEDVDAVTLQARQAGGEMLPNALRRGVVRAEPQLG